MVVCALAEKSMWNTLKVAQAANRHAIALCAEEAGTIGSNPIRALHYRGNPLHHTAAAAQNTADTVEKCL